MGQGTSARWVAALLLCAAGCGRAHDDDLIIGRDDPKAAAGTRTPAAGTGSASFGNAGRGGRTAPAMPRDAGVSAEIRDREGVALEVVTVGCSGECFEVEASARGGYPPYTYRWEDGAEGPIRKLCPEATQTFRVAATDSGFASDEFTREAETAEANVTAEVLACPADAGAPMMPTTDAGMPRPMMPGPTHWEPLCIPNGSFEDESGAPWRYCGPDDASMPLDIVTPWGLDIYPVAIDGMRYLRLTPAPNRPVTISVPFCGAVTAGVGYYWKIAALRSAQSDGVRLEFYFSKSECFLEGFLFHWDLFDAWIQGCSTWPIDWDANYLVIRAVATGETTAPVYVDALVEDPQLCREPL